MQPVKVFLKLSKKVKSLKTALKMFSSTKTNRPLMKTLRQMESYPGCCLQEKEPKACSMKLRKLALVNLKGHLFRRRQLLPLAHASKCANKESTDTAPLPLASVLTFMKQVRLETMLRTSRTLLSQLSPWKFRALPRTIKVNQNSTRKLLFRLNYKRILSCSRWSFSSNYKKANLKPKNKWLNQGMTKAPGCLLFALSMSVIKRRLSRRPAT